MQTNDFKIVFGMDEHEVDVETLIGCLMHTSNLIHEVNHSLTIDTDKKIEIKIKALEQGSFEINIGLVEKTLETLFTKDGVKYSVCIIKIVSGIYKFINFLKGNKPKEVKEEDKDQFKVIDSNNNSITIYKNVYNIYNENQKVRDTISEQFEVLEKNKNIKNFTFDSQKDKITIKSEDFKAISTKIDSTSYEFKEPIVKIIEDVNILIVRPSFTHNLKWDFEYKGNKISAKMNDDDMKNIIDNGESFAKGDHMMVDLEETMFYDPDLETNMITKDSYKIKAYKKHIKSPSQLEIFD